MTFETLIQEAETILSKDILFRTMEDLSKLHTITNQFSMLIPLTKKSLRLKELEADNAEKEHIIEERRKKNNIEQAKAEARLIKNKILVEAIDIEYQYLVLYQFYKDIESQIPSTRIALKL